MATVNPKCTECYGTGWVHTTREQNEEWYDRHPDRSRPSYYSSSAPCPACAPESEPSQAEEIGSLLSKLAGH